MSCVLNKKNETLCNILSFVKLQKTKTETKTYNAYKYTKNFSCCLVHTLEFLPAILIFFVLVTQFFFFYKSCDTS